jgi:thiamine-monophosphate kinase
MNEFGIIAKHFAPLAKNFIGALGLKDDAAIISPKSGFDLVVTKDAMVADVHFFATDEPSLIAKKLLAMNLSDLAAMGASSLGYLLAVMLPLSTDDEWLAEFAAGLAESIDQFGGSLIGGDTVSHDGALALSLTAIGEVPQGKALKRSGAKIGDLVFVSGTMGDSYLGLNILRGNIDAHSEYLVSRYYVPTPRIALGAKLLGIANSCIDVSDGMVADLGHITQCSGVGAKIELAAIPLSDEAQRIAANPVDLITGGDDYELLFTAPASAQPSIEAIAKELNLPITKIGEITQGDRVVVLDNKGVEVSFETGGYRHF